MSEPSTNSTECLNCHAPLSGSFCQNCGQSKSVHRITFKETIGEFFSSTFALEGQLLSTIRLLIVNPGKLFREFIGGKRKPYYKPVAFFVVMTAVYLILKALIGYDPLEGEMLEVDENSPEFVQSTKKAAYFMTANINNILFFLVLAISINHKLFFRKSYNMAEYVTTGFFITGIFTLFGTLVMLADHFLVAIPSQVALLFLVLYTYYTAYSFHQRKSFWVHAKYGLLSFLTMVLYVFFSFGFSLLVVMFLQS